MPAPLAPWEPTTAELAREDDTYWDNLYDTDPDDD